MGYPAETSTKSDRNNATEKSGIFLTPFPHQRISRPRQDVTALLQLLVQLFLTLTGCNQRYKRGRILWLGLSLYPSAYWPYLQFQLQLHLLLQMGKAR